MNHRQPEQPNNVQFPAEPEPEYTLEEIMAEFGAPQEPTPESVPEPASEPVSEPAPEQAPEPIPEPEPEPEAEPVQPESPPPGPQQERVHVFRPVPDRRPPRPERSAPAPKPKAKKRPVQIVERPKPEPEPPTPQQALQLCSAGLGGRRARLTVSGLLMLMQLLLVCYGQFSLQFLPFLSGKLQLLLPAALLGLQMLLSADALWQGVRDPVHPSLYTPGAVLCVLALLDSVQQLSAGTPGYAAPAALVLFGLLHALTREREGLTRTLRAVCGFDRPLGVRHVPQLLPNEDGLRCAPGDTRDFMRHLSDPDPAARTFRIYTLLALPGTLLAALALSRLGPMGFVRCWLILLLGATPCAAMLSFARPFSALARRLASFGAALCGWHGARVLGGKHTVILRDEDVFPANNITSSGMKLYGTLPAGQVLSYALAALEAAQDPLAALFDRLLQAQFGRRCRADAYRCYDGGGIGAQIGQDVVLVGSLPFMRSMGVHMSDGARVRQAVYVSVNGELAGIFAVKYKPSASTRAGLRALLANPGNSVILATRDFLITPELLAARYELAVGGIAFPVYSERLRLSEAVGGEADAQGALIAKETFGAFASAVAAAQTLRSTTRFSTVLSLLSGILGLCLCALLLYWGSAAAVSPFHIAAFQLIWALVAGFLSGILQRL